MANPAPLIDERTEKEIAEQVQSLLTAYIRTPAWQEFDPATGQPLGVSRALISIFARDAALIIQRLNQAPDKNFLAFLDLLGAALLPPNRRVCRSPSFLRQAAPQTRPFRQERKPPRLLRQAKRSR